MENLSGVCVDGNKLIGSGFELTFENYIEEVLEDEGHYFIHVSACDKIENGVRARGDIKDNIYCVDENGKIVWRIKELPPARRTPCSKVICISSVYRKRRIICAQIFKKNVRFTR